MRNPAKERKDIIENFEEFFRFWANTRWKRKGTRRKPSPMEIFEKAKDAYLSSATGIFYTEHDGNVFTNRELYFLNHFKSEAGLEPRIVGKKMLIKNHIRPNTPAIIKKNPKLTDEEFDRITPVLKPFPKAYVAAVKYFTIKKT